MSGGMCCVHQLLSLSLCADSMLLAGCNLILETSTCRRRVAINVYIGGGTWDPPPTTITNPTPPPPHATEVAAGAAAQCMRHPCMSSCVCEEGHVGLVLSSAKFGDRTSALFWGWVGPD
ncbi:unnamed protein product [Arctogadus glacialis]